MICIASSLDNLWVSRIHLSPTIVSYARFTLHNHNNKDFSFIFILKLQAGALESFRREMQMQTDRFFLKYFCYEERKKAGRDKKREKT